MDLILILWYLVFIVQGFFGYGTAYRLTKSGGDNGVAMWGWLFLMSLAAIIPGLGIWLWIKYKDDDRGYGGHPYDRDSFYTGGSDMGRHNPNQNSRDDEDFRGR